MDANLEGLRQRFEQDPSDLRAFEALEEAHFVAGEWPALVALYERRLSAPDLDAGAQPGARARLLLRLGQVLEERCMQPDLAVERYRAALHLEPTLRPALAQLRSIYSRRSQWDLALQVAELEAALPMRPAEQAVFLCELGEIWLRHLQDAEQALQHFQRAHEAAPGHAPAWLGAAAAHEACGDSAAAAEALDQAVGLLRGAERARALVRLARLAEGPLADPDRAAELFRQALGEDPLNPEALEAGAQRAAEARHWELFEELQERRFNLTSGAVRRLAIAHDAGRAALEEARNPQSARLWFGRALELFPDDPVVHLYLADVERLSGNQTALAEHLRRAADLADEAAPVEVLVESAQLARAGGDDELAASQLRRAAQRDPTRSDVLDELATTLHQLGRDEDLLEVLEAGVTATPEGSGARVEALVRLAVAQEERTHDVQAALDAYQRAAAIDPAAPLVVEGIEGLLRKEERFDELRAHLERSSAACQADPKRAAGLQCALAELLVHPFEDLDGAKQHFQAALALDEESVRARQGLERVALALGDDDALLDAFEREAAVTTDRGRLSFLVGELSRIFQERGEAERALGWLERLLEVLPEDRETLEQCARLQGSLGRRTERRRSLERLDVLLEGGQRAENRREVAALYRDEGNAEQAIRWYRASLEAEPEHVGALAALESLLEAADRPEEQAEALRRRASLLTAEDRAAALDRLARLLAERLDREDEAATVLLEVVRLPEAPEDAEARLEELLHRLERWEELAGRLAERRQALDPLDPLAFELDLRRAELLAGPLRRPTEAVALFDAVRETRPDSHPARDGLERALRSVGDAERLAALLAERAAEVQDHDERANLELERASWLERVVERLPEARVVLQEVADGDSGVASQAEERLEALLERTGDLAGLRRRLETHAERGSVEAQVARRRRLAALCRDRLRDPEAAIVHLEAAGRLSPESTEIWQGLARLYEDADRPRDLVRVLEAELAVQAETGRALVLHSRVASLALDVLDDPELAERHYRAALEIDPHLAPAIDFLTERYESQERHAELAGLLETRLASLPDEEVAAGTEAVLRLRLSALQAGPLGAPEQAITTLETAAASEANLAVLADPLADLYQRTGRVGDLLALSRRAAEAAETAAEQAQWHLRIADALRREGDQEGSADAYRRALAGRPDDRDIQAALRDLYRELDEAEPLCRLLEAELARVGGREELPLRLELAHLLGDRLARKPEALAHLRRVLEIDPEHREALTSALSLAEQAAEAAEHADLLERALRAERDPLGRAGLLSRLGTLLAARLDRPEQAIPRLEEALALDPAASQTRSTLRAIFEGRGDRDGVLRCIESELSAPGISSQRRAALLEEGARLAGEHLGPDASLSWLERLRALRPDDPTWAQWITGVHRAADRPADLLRALEEELVLGPAPERCVTLHRERAHIYEERLGAPGRAVACLEEARAVAPRDGGVLHELERLYAAMGRADRRADVLDELAESAGTADRLARLRTAADARREAGDLRGCADRLWTALGAASAASVDRVEILGELGDIFAALGRGDLQTQVAERELSELDPQAPVYGERRRELHLLLARLHRTGLGRPDRAIIHLRALLDDGLLKPSGEGAASFEAAERELLDLLRAGGRWVELEIRLAARMKRLHAEGDDGDAGEWLELGRLRDERLHRPGAAAEAFREALAREPKSLPAVRGLRSAAERLGDAESVAATLEQELEIRPDATPSERAALLRKLGVLCWKALDSTTRAGRAFGAALEADPGDLFSLRALEALSESMEDWAGALELYDREVALLGGDAAARRQEIWLRVAELARDRTGELPRALRAFEEAAAVGEMPSPRLAEWADLYERLDQPDRFAEVFSRWIDAADSAAGAADQLRLAQALEGLGRREEALARARRAVGHSPTVEGFEAVARLELSLGRSGPAADALAEAADRHSGRRAASLRLLAAALVEEGDPERAATLLERGAEEDPALPLVHARRARVAARLGRGKVTLQAAERALALPDGLPDAERLATALVGARAAWDQGETHAAARLFDEVLAVTPDHPEALSRQAEILASLGDFDLARELLERRLAHAEPDPERTVHLTLLGEALEAGGETDAAVERYREAIGLEPGRDEAHQRLADLLERSDRLGEAVDALQAWAARARDGASVAERLLRAAEVELRREGREEPAEGLLREALSAAPGTSRAWALLAELLWRAGRGEEVVRTAEQAAPEDLDPPDRARLERVRAQALEAAGDRRKAADAWCAVCDADPTCCEAALQGARLLRALGEWRAAADRLGRFVEAAPEPDAPAVAEALYQLGRLLAGPLEDLDAAIDSYRRALVIDPELGGARESLADLLVHRPEHWGEAVSEHAALLAANPLRLTSLRGLLRIARGRGSAPAVASGLAILRALGVATPEERIEAPARAPLAPARTMADPIWEAARCVAQEASREIAEALGVGSQAAAGEAPSDPVARFRARVIQEEGALSAPALVPRPTPELGEIVTLVAQLALDVPAVHGNGDLVNGLSRTLGRRVRRRLRRLLEGVDAEAVASIDFAAWRAELRGLASAAALAADEAELRTAFLAWTHAGDSRLPPPESDLREAIASRPEACALLHHLVDCWIAGL